MKIPEMFDAAVEGSLKAMYIFGEDVAQTDPDTAHVEKALESLDFLVCQDIFETETTKFADVILPASAFLEKTGTFTNAERRLQMVEPGARAPRLGAHRLRHHHLGLEGHGLRHGLRDPVRRDGRGGRDDAALRRHLARADRPPRAAVAGRARRHRHADPVRGATSRPPAGWATSPPLPYKPPGDAADDEFPLILVTGRRLEHYNAGTMTRRTENLTLMPSDSLEMHPEDAAAQGLAPATRCGRARAWARCGSRWT